MRECEDKSVRMRFDDGYECVATLVSATQDMDGSLHLVYEKVEWASDDRHLAYGGNTALYTPGEMLLSIEEAIATNSGT